MKNCWKSGINDDNQSSNGMLETGMQRDDYLQGLIQTELLLEYAIKEGDGAEIARLNAKLDRLALLGECKLVWDGNN